MRIGVLGAGGDMGRRVATDLLESGVEVVAADLEPTALDGLGETERVVFDVTDYAAADRLESLELDGVVSAVGPFYRFGERTLELAIEAGVPYVDLCDDHDATATQLGHDEEASQAGVPAVVGCGWTPGITNVLARREAEGLDGPVDVYIDWIGSADDAEGHAVLLHVLHVTAGAVPQYRNGRVRDEPAGSDPFTLYVPEIGRARTRVCGHPEPVTLPDHLDAETVVLRGGLVDEWQNRLLGLVARAGPHPDSRKERVAGLVQALEGIAPSGGVERSAAVVTVEGTDGKRTVAAVGRMADLTGCAASVGIQQLVGGHADPGVHPPEAVYEPNTFLGAVADRPIRFYRWHDGRWETDHGGP